MVKNYKHADLSFSLSKWYSRSIAVLVLVLLLWAATLPAQQEPKPDDPQAKRDSPADYTSETSAGHTITSTVVWPSRTERNSEVRSKLSLDVLSNIDSASLPVLLPHAEDLQRDMKIYVSAYSYSASAVNPDLGISLSVSGSKAFFAPPPGTPDFAAFNDSVRGVPATFRQSEGVIWSLTWEQYGVAYIVHLSCDTLVTDVCSDESYLRSIAEDLVFAGGNFAI